jgi:hypothetical protein
MGLGLAPLTLVKTCPRYYGICLSQNYDYRHIDARAANDKVSAGQLVRDQATWLMQQDDIIPTQGPLVKETPVHFKLSRNDVAELDKVQVIFVATAVTDPPSNLRELSKGMLAISHPHIVTNFLGHRAQRDHQVECRYPIHT